MNERLKVVEKRVGSLEQKFDRHCGVDLNGQINTILSGVAIAILVPIFMRVLFP